jgi:hypothetical protein
MGREKVRGKRYEEALTMNGYFLITDLKRPSEVRSRLATSMADIAKVSEVPPDSVRVDAVEGIDLCREADRNRVIQLIMKVIRGCGESEAQMGYFRD